MDKLIRFAAVGVLTALVYFVLLVVGQRWAGLSLPLAGAVAYLVALPVNYLLHRRWTFQSSRSHAAALPRYAVNLVCGLALNAAFLNAARGLGPLAVFGVQLAAMACLSLVSYLIMAAWVFVAPAAPAEA